MKLYAEIDYLNIENNSKYEELIQKVIQKCFETENLDNTKLYISIVLTDSQNIRKINKEYRNIDKETDVLSFPMFEKNEIKNISISENEDILGDIVISVEKVIAQAKEYEHSFERELSYMIVHGFYHIMGEDHIEEKDKIVMRQKEENILEQLKILRNNNNGE